YHVLFPVNRNPAGEAAAFATHAGDVDLIVLDLERTDGLPAQAVLDQARVWLIEAEAHFGKRPVIYTGSWFWDGPSYVGPATPAGWEFQYDLWEAEYTRQFPWGGVDPSQAPIGQPMDLSDGFVGWKFWQWTSAGKPTGVQSGSLDYDVFNGTEAELRVYLGLAPPPATCEQQVAILNREAALRGWNLTP
ncbi:MAG: GH25 family lysozyme, partial [Anaerolineales bacterium]